MGGHYSVALQVYEGSIGPRRRSPLPFFLPEPPKVASDDRGRADESRPCDLPQDRKGYSVQLEPAEQHNSNLRNKYSQSKLDLKKIPGACLAFPVRINIPNPACR